MKCFQRYRSLSPPVRNKVDMLYKCVISHVFLLTFCVLIVRIKLLEADPGVKDTKMSVYLQKHNLV